MINMSLYSKEDKKKKKEVVEQTSTLYNNRFKQE